MAEIEAEVATHGSRTGHPAWVECLCDEYWCTVHGCHASECPCPGIDAWAVDPYVDGGRELAG